MKFLNKIDSDHSKIRPSYYTPAKHINDHYLNLGYDYHGNMLKKGTSPELWANPHQEGMFMKIEGILNYLVDEVKTIKKWFMIAYDKKTIKLN